METNEEFKKVGAEVYAVLKNVPIQEYNKIPKHIRDLFEEYKEESKKVIVDTDKSFNEQNISKQAKDIIFVISLNYWLNEEQKQIAMSKINENEIELNKKYDIERLFKEKQMSNKSEISEVFEKVDNNFDTNTSKALVKNYGKWYNKIVDFFRKLFKKF